MRIDRKRADRAARLPFVTIQLLNRVQMALCGIDRHKRWVDPCRRHAHIMQRARSTIQAIDIDPLGLALDMRLAARVGADIYDLIVAHYEVLLRRLVREVWRADALQDPFL